MWNARRLSCLHHGTVAGFFLFSAMLLNGCGGGSAAAIENGDYPVIPITPELVAQPQTSAPPASTMVQQPDIPARQAAQYRYRIGPGDTLSYRLWDGMQAVSASALDGVSQPVSIKVEENGTATFPVAGTLQVQHQTIHEIRAQLMARLRIYFNAPRFDVQLQEFHSSQVTVSGAVKKPGIQYLGYEPLTVRRAIEQAGGAEPFADLTAAEIVHADNRRETVDLQALLYQADQSQQRLLLPGDTLLLSENHRNRVFLMGEAIKTGALYIKAGKLSLTEALNDPQSPASESQGPRTLTATIGNIYVIRGALAEAPEGTPTIYRLDTSSPVTYALGDRFMLQPRDVIYITPSAVTEWHRVLSQILPANFGLSKGIN